MKPWSKGGLVAAAFVGGIYAGAAQQASAQRTFGGPIEVLAVSTLVEAADLIVTGHVTHIADERQVQIETPEGARLVWRRIATVAVDQVLHGKLSSQVVSFVYVSRGDPRHEISESVYRLFFLAWEEESYFPASSRYPTVIAAPGPVLGDAVVDRVATAIGAVLKAPEIDRRSKFDALWALRYAGSDLVPTYLRAGLEDQDRTIQLTVAGYLLELDDMAGLPYTDALLAPEKEPPAGLAALRQGLDLGLKNGAAVPQLERLLAVEEVETRRAAATALRRTDSSSAIPALARALNDGDRDVRYCAVAGLAQIVRDTANAASVDRFPYEEQRLLAYWREWARQRKLLE